jgi:hypothetical protein
VRQHGHKLVQLPPYHCHNPADWMKVQENNTFKVTNKETLPYEARQNTDFSLHGCVDQAENMLENL